ncbi:hypothetical protein DFS34DRAFT_248610 [Phlyctochytrium arcticum]|nr:hypothetical protein DFS34DRAFT_248610 [Phlyctochytrium arcticum]
MKLNISSTARLQQYMTLPPEVPADLHETFHRQAKEVCTELLGYLYYLLENICMNAAETDTCLSFDEDPIASQWKVLESCELLKCWLGLEGIDLDEPELRDTWLLSLLHIGILETNLNSHGRNLAPQIRIAIVGLMFEICRDDFVATVLEELTDDDLLTLLTLLLHVLESDTRATVLDGAGIIMRRIVEMEGARMASVLASRNRSKDRSVVKQPSTRVTLPDTQRVASQSQSPSPPGHISDSPPASYPPANSQRSSSDLSQNAIAELTRLESSLATTRAHIQKEADLQVAIAAQKMALYASRTTALEDELKVWEGRTAELERELRKRDRRLTDLGTGMKTMEKEKEREATGRKEAESLASRLRGDLKLANQRTEALSKEMQDAKQNIEELTSANKQLNADVDTEKGQFATLEQDYVTFRQTAETRQATLEAEIATLNDQNAALQSSLMLLESKIKDRDERIRELEAANEELEAELGDRDQAQEEMFERMRISMSKGRKNRAGGDGSTVKRGREKNNQE